MKPTRVIEIEAQCRELVFARARVEGTEREKITQQLEKLWAELRAIDVAEHRKLHPEFYEILDRVGVTWVNPVGRFRSANHSLGPYPCSPAYVLEVRSLPDGEIEVEQIEAVGYGHTGMVTVNSPADLPRRAYTMYYPGAPGNHIRPDGVFDELWGHQVKAWDQQSDNFRRWVEPERRWLTLDDYIGYSKRRLARAVNLTLQDVREELEDYAREYGRPAARKLLEAVGVKSVSALTKLKYQQVFDACATAPADDE